MKKALCWTLLAGATLAGCAVEGPPREPVADREYVTGSNLPRRAGSSSSTSVYTHEEAERMRDQQIIPMDSPRRQPGG